MTDGQDNKAIDPHIATRFAKERYLLTLSEDNFRDQVVRPLFYRMGFGDGRDLCGPTEEGKDTIFTHPNPLGQLEVYAIQTKKGSLNLGKKKAGNIVEACTQLNTALKTKVYFIKSKESKYPDKVILCSSGKINDSAKKHIIDEVKDARITFLDADDLIPLLDDKIPEIWLGIDASLIPYLRALKRSVEEIDYTSVAGDLLPRTEVSDSASDEMYVVLRLYRTVQKRRKVKGKMESYPTFEEMPVQGILGKRETLFLIIGDAGSGKSTALRRLAYTIAKKARTSQDQLLIPVLLKCAELAAQVATKALVEICANETMRLSNSSKPSFSMNDLASGRLLILLDGLDEIGNDASRRKVLELVETFHRDYPQCRMVITSRDYQSIANLGELTRFAQYRISPISYKEAGQILKKFKKKKKVLSEDASKEILRRLQDIHGMELNPLLVTVFAATSDYSRKDIPANITELFKKFTEMMLGRWDESKGLAQQYHAPLKDFILTQVGFTMHRDKVSSISLSEFKGIIERELESRGHLGDAAQLTDEVLYRSNLFRVIQDRVEFRHHLLQEFFAGRGIPAEEFIKEHVADYWWQRPIVFYFGDKPGSATELANIVAHIDKTTNGTLFVSALTIGLSLQASYLVKVDPKTELLHWVIASLSNSRKDLFESNDKPDPHPLTNFIAYYLVGRDAVALDLLSKRVTMLLNRYESSNISTEDVNFYKFWVIVGLIESGELDAAEEVIQDFHPADPRLLLAIHMGCFIINNLRVSTTKQKKAASRIISRLQGKVWVLRDQLIKEFESELLEVRKGEIKAIEPPKE